jgi:SgrR family transcriptional regulator
MIFEQYYLDLRQKHTLQPKDIGMEITLQELAEVFKCSERNVNLILRKMEEHKWIEWRPGRGRGNRSQLTFLASSEALVLKIAQDLVKKGDIKAAFAHLDAFAFLPFVKEQFMYWLDTNFGFRSEMKNKQVMETLRIPYTKPIDFLDPGFMYFAAESHIIKHVFDCLVKYNVQTGMIEPHLAHHWQKNQHGTEWWFYLRKGVFFHHGRELTAHDVKFSFERLQRKEINSPYRWMFAIIAQIEVVNTYVVRIQLHETNYLFLRYLCADPASIVPQDAVHDMGDRFMKFPIGTGPFKLLKNDLNMVVLEANPRYFDKRAHLDRIEIWITPEANAQSVLNEKHDYQIRLFGSMSNTDDQADWKKIETTSRGCHFFTFNLSKHGPQQNESFRKALFYGFDRLNHLKRICEFDAEPADSFFPESSVTANHDVHDLNLAKELLAESGYANEELILYAPHIRKQDIAWVFEQCDLLGIRITLANTSKDGRERDEEVKNADLYLGCIVMEEGIEYSLIELFLSENSCIRNHAGAELLEELERILSRIYLDSSAVGRLQKIQELEKLIKQHYAVMFLYHRRQKSLVHPALKGASLNSLGWVDFRNVWFEPVALFSS